MIFNYLVTEAIIVLFVSSASIIKYQYIHSANLLSSCKLVQEIEA